MAIGMGAKIMMPRRKRKSEPAEDMLGLVNLFRFFVDGVG